MVSPDQLAAEELAAAHQQLYATDMAIWDVLRHDEAEDRIVTLDPPRRFDVATPLGILLTSNQANEVPPEAGNRFCGHMALVGSLRGGRSQESTEEWPLGWLELLGAVDQWGGGAPVLVLEFDQLATPAPSCSVFVRPLRRGEDRALTDEYRIFCVPEPEGIAPARLEEILALDAVVRAAKELLPGPPVA